ncbi:hypothetical protein EDF81_2704 [Enterobacter sp. BIGb0383]|uniref:hypothetical protein n=1 Tax=unclassified Enterobacter TaxID=2608935 RepID=UPI000F4863E5|nr:MULTISPECIES: hypothetical protein [unclassified Enterobacter]ROP59884.1 hypothetical protein EDF81_2704 [Enterobacter sp. BIGb0383]ROS08647.1 hypothetical protein EC848_2132 [Enterobacter sp. BIGb0359]
MRRFTRVLLLTLAIGWSSLRLTYWFMGNFANSPDDPLIYLILKLVIFCGSLAAALYITRHRHLQS